MFPPPSPAFRRRFLLLRLVGQRRGQDLAGFTAGDHENTGPANFTASTILGQFREFTGTTDTHITDAATDTITDTTFEVQVKASNGNGIGEWSQSGTGTAGYVPSPLPPSPPLPPEEGETTTTTGAGSGGVGGGFGGLAPPAPSTPPRPASSFQPVAELFGPLSSAGALTRVWRFLPRSQTWLFYDPDPRLSPFNTMRTLNVAEDPPNVVVVGVERSHVFRVLRLFRGWNYIPITQQPLSPGAGTQSVRQLLAPLIGNRTLERVWWLDSRTQEWKFFDPDPALSAFNTISTLNLAANPPVVLMINVTRGQVFRGQELFPGWNDVLIR